MQANPCVFLYLPFFFNSFPQKYFLFFSTEMNPILCVPLNTESPNKQINPPTKQTQRGSLSFSFSHTPDLPFSLLDPRLEQNYKTQMGTKQMVRNWGILTLEIELNWTRKQQAVPPIIIGGNISWPLSRCSSSRRKFRV